MRVEQLGGERAGERLDSLALGVTEVGELWCGASELSLAQRFCTELQGFDGVDGGLRAEPLLVLIDLGGDDGLGGRGFS